jgi:ornithine cyclodeaminase
MTADHALRLSSGQALRALDEIDLVELVAERLASADRDEVASVLLREPGRAWSPSRPRVAEIAVEDTGTGAVALLPAATLRIIWGAGLAALAGRLLAAPGVVTAAVFGSGAGLGFQVAILARYLPMVSHVTVPRALSFSLTEGDSAEEGSSVLAQLELAGVGTSVVPDSRRAALGANLLVLSASARRVPDIGPPAPGALLVNAAGRDLPRRVLDRVDRVYVDDLRLVAASQHREFLRGRAGPRAGPPVLPLNREGWYRHREAGQGPVVLAAGLGDVLAGTGPGRTSDEEVMLAELLGATVVDAALAWRLWRSAAERGLGSWVGTERK